MLDFMYVSEDDGDVDSAMEEMRVFEEMADHFDQDFSQDELLALGIDDDVY